MRKPGEEYMCELGDLGNGECVSGETLVGVFLRVEETGGDR